MKLATLTKLSPALILAIALCGNVAKANPIITGGLNFDGLATTNSGDLLNATAFSSIYDVYVFPGSTGSYASLPLFAGPVTFTPFSFSAAAVTPLWTFTVGSVTYSFDATSIMVVAQSKGGLLLEGNGWASITGYQTTLGSWSIDDTTTTHKSAIFNFGADTAALPDSGGTALLIGLGLAGVAAGMVAQRRRLAKG
jgi:hypothetical protein